MPSLPCGPLVACLAQSLCVYSLTHSRPFVPVWHIWFFSSRPPDLRVAFPNVSQFCAHPLFRSLSSCLVFTGSNGKRPFLSSSRLLAPQQIRLKICGINIVTDPLVMIWASVIPATYLHSSCVCARMHTGQVWLCSSLSALESRFLNYSPSSSVLACCFLM